MNVETIHLILSVIIGGMVGWNGRSAWSSKNGTFSIWLCLWLVWARAVIPVSIVTDKPLDVRAFTRDWAAFAAEVSTNRVLAGRLMRIVELALEQPADDLHADIIHGETRIAMELIAKEVRRA